jgi:hypothetical protein
MSQKSLFEILRSGEAPPNIRNAVARGLAPLPPEELMRALVLLTSDDERVIATSARKTLAGMDHESVIDQLKSHNCDVSVLEYFAINSQFDTILQTIIGNPSTPGTLIESLSLTLSPELLMDVLDNKVRVLEHPGILKNIKRNPLATREIQRMVQEIETEFLGSKKKEYVIERPQEEAETGQDFIPELKFEISTADLSLDGLPIDDPKMEALVSEKLSQLPFREKIRYALFGNRQIRSLLIRDTNREISRMVLRSPKITDSEVESISSMRSINEDILRDIGNSKDFTKSYNVVHNLIKNPKTPPLISQRLIFRLRNHDLSMLARDRSIAEVVRFHATRMINQRSRKGSK